MTTRRWIATTAACGALSFVVALVTVTVSMATAPQPARRPVGTMTAGPPVMRGLP